MQHEYIVSPSLALTDAQYAFELEGTLGTQEPLKWQIYSTKHLKMDIFLC